MSVIPVNWDSFNKIVSEVLERKAQTGSVYELKCYLSHLQTLPNDRPESTG